MESAGLFDGSNPSVPGRKALQHATSGLSSEADPRSAQTEFRHRPEAAVAHVPGGPSLGRRPRVPHAQSEDAESGLQVERQLNVLKRKQVKILLGDKPRFVRSIDSTGEEKRLFMFFAELFADPFGN